MAELLGSTDAVLSLVFLPAFGGLLVQCVLLFYKVIDPQDGKLAAVLEAALLAYMAWLGWFIGVLKSNLYEGLVILPGPDLRLWAVPAVVLGLGLTVRSPRTRYWLVGGLLLCMSPIADDIFPGSLAARLAIANSGLLVSGIGELVRQVRETRQGITDLSIKEALDQLPDGLIFAAEAGQPVSVNMRAHQMLASLGLSAHDRVDIIWDALLRHKGYAPDVASSDSRLVRSPDDRCLYFLRYEVRPGKRRLQQVHARDVTREYSLAEMLRIENMRLEDSIKDLKSLLEQTRSMALEKELGDSRAQLHDVLSQRISLVRALLANGRLLPGTAQVQELQRLLSSIDEDLFALPAMPPVALLERLIQIYRTMGIDIVQQGGLPDDSRVAEVFTQILREAFSNALRHGGASKIAVMFGEDRADWHITVANNGSSPSHVLREGNGIGGMRTRLQPLRGSLAVETVPEFALRVRVPK